MKRPYWQVYQDDAGQWRWRLRAANNRILADSGEGYTRERDCHRAIKAVKFAMLRVGQ